MFRKVLVLITSFTLPTVYQQGAKDFLDTMGYLHSSTVSDELVHGSSLTDDVLESVDELLFGCHSDDVHDEGLTPNVELGHSLSIRSNGCDFGEESVRCNRFVPAPHIVRWKWRLERLIDDVPGHNIRSKLGCHFECASYFLLRHVQIL